MDSLKKTTFKGIFWKTAERLGAQGVSFIVSIVLARLLSPEDYGVIALISIFITISNVFILSGLGTALIQKKDADDLDFSSVFFCSIFISVIAYMLLFLCAPRIASFYDEPVLIPVIRVLGIGLLFTGINSVQNAYISKTMQFKKFFFATLGGTLVSAVVGIFLAIKGFGVWALVFQQLTNTTIDTIILWLTVKWRPKFKFSLARLKTLYAFGWKMLATSLMQTIYSNVYGLIIGKVYDSTWLGLYNKGNNFPNLIVSNIVSPIQSVLLPAMSSQQDDKVKIKNIIRQSVKMCSFVFFPVLIGMAAVSDALVGILLTDKWNSCIPFLQISCITLAFLPIQIANIQAIGAIGRGDIYLKLEIIKEIIGYILLVISIPFGIYAMVIGKAIQSFLAFLINAYPNRKLFDYSVGEQLKDIFPAFLLSIIMGIIVTFIRMFDLNDMVTLIIQMICGGIIYVGLSCVIKLDSMYYVFNMIKARGKVKNDK